MHGYDSEFAHLKPFRQQKKVWNGKGLNRRYQKFFDAWLLLYNYSFIKRYLLYREEITSLADIKHSFLNHLLRKSELYETQLQ